MKNFFLFLFLPFLFPAVHLFGQNVKNPTRPSSTMLFDFDWKFHLGGALGAEDTAYNDALWRNIDLPHDWSIEDRLGMISPFDSLAVSQVEGGFTTGGTGWYRKTFTLPLLSKAKRVLIQFDGVYVNSEIWVNGVEIGVHPNGYTSFYFDITKAVRFGKKNIVALEVKNEGRNSRWYAGSGIYRHVWLKLLDPVHLDQWGTTVRSTLPIPGTGAELSILNRIKNDSKMHHLVKLMTTVIDSSDAVISTAVASHSIGPSTSFEFKQAIMVKKPRLWSCTNPSLYYCRTRVYTDGQFTDSVVQPFGIRTVSFDATHGFVLNGKALKLKGGCIHHDNGPLGSRAYDRAEERKVELLKASGFNAIRTSHNPPSPALLDVCDRLGMLVIDEFSDMWQEEKNPYDYHLYFDKWWKKDVESMVTRDINHPSIVLWSIGNEIPERAKPNGIRQVHQLADYFRKLDPTRAVTSAVNGPGPDKDAYFSALDVGGYNYAASIDSDINKTAYETDHLRRPNRVMVGTESFPLSSYASWKEVLNNAYVIGDFVWTAFDYIGEASIGWLGYEQSGSFYPWNLAYCGDIDVCGFKRPQSYYRDALWKPNQVSIFVASPKPFYRPNPRHRPWSAWNWEDVWPSWTWPGMEGKPLQISVYSSFDSVAFYLNGHLLGKTATGNDHAFRANFKTIYQPGQLKAVGFNRVSSSSPLSTDSAILTTASKAYQIKLSADHTVIKSDGEDLCYVAVEITDKAGLRNPNADNLFHFAINGPAAVVGVGNALPYSVESNQRLERKAWKGQCMVILKASKTTGKAILTVNSQGLKSSSIEIDVR